LDLHFGVSSNPSTGFIVAACTWFVGAADAVNHRPMVVVGMLGRRFCVGEAGIDTAGDNE
jgi:hypothetical protein